MRIALIGVLIGLLTASALAQAPGPGGPNRGEFNGPGQGGPGGPGGRGGPGGPRMMGPPNAMFSAIDVDGDGTITKAELRKAIVALKKLDADGDGNITLAEVSPMGGPMGPFGGDPAQMVDRMMQGDKDGDGKLSADELPGRMGERMLQDGDTNGDGALDRDEITSSMENMRNRFRGGPGGPGGPGGFPGGPAGFRGGAGGANFDPTQMTGQMMQFDRNRDGKLSADEVPQQAMGMLRNADMNNDGVIEAGEIQAAAERMGERFRGNSGRGQRRRGGRDDGDDGQSANPRNNR